jgi:hypothetical protein
MLKIITRICVVTGISILLFLGGLNQLMYIIPIWIILLTLSFWISDEKLMTGPKGIKSDINIQYITVFILGLIGLVFLAIVLPIQLVRQFILK